MRTVNSQNRLPWPDYTHSDCKNLLSQGATLMERICSNSVSPAEKGSWTLTNLTLKAPRKTASENVVCLCLLNILANLFLHTGKQRGPRSDCSDLGPHCLQKWLLKSQADDKADIVVIGALRFNACDGERNEMYRAEVLCNLKSKKNMFHWKVKYLYLRRAITICLLPTSFLLCRFAQHKELISVFIYDTNKHGFLILNRLRKKTYFMIIHENGEVSPTSISGSFAQTIAIRDLVFEHFKRMNWIERSYSKDPNRLGCADSSEHLLYTNCIRLLGFSYVLLSRYVVFR